MLTSVSRIRERRPRRCARSRSTTPLVGAVVAGPKPCSAAPDARRRAGAGGANAVARGRDRLRVRRRARAEPHAVRVPGAVAQGAVAHQARATATARHLRLEGLSFGAGVIVTFLALAGILLAFRAAGEQFGWGFQLQSPAVVTSLALLFFVLALNLSGVFEFATLVPSSAAGWTRAQPVRECRAVRRARGRHRVAVHRAVHGCGAGVRARAASGAARCSCSRRSGSAWRCRSCCSPGSRVGARCCRKPGRVDGAPEAVPRVPAVRDRGVARLGAGRASRQRRRRAPAGDARRAVVRAVGVACLSRRRRDRRSRSRRCWGSSASVVVAWPLYVAARPRRRRRCRSRPTSAASDPWQPFTPALRDASSRRARPSSSTSRPRGA